MTPQETLARLRVLTDPTPEQLREASDLALLAMGWTTAVKGKNKVTYWYRPDGVVAGAIASLRPHPCASIDDAVRWMVPEGWTWEGGTHRDPGPLFVWIVRGPEDQKRPEGQYGVGFANIPALALTIAGLAAIIETTKDDDQ